MDYPSNSQSSTSDDSTITVLSNETCFFNKIVWHKMEGTNVLFKCVDTGKETEDWWADNRSKLNMGQNKSIKNRLRNINSETKAQI